MSCLTLEQPTKLSLSPIKLGFKIFSLMPEKLSAPGLSQSEDTEFNEGFDASPLIGGKLVAFDGAETHVYA